MMPGTMTGLYQNGAAQKRFKKFQHENSSRLSWKNRMTDISPCIGGSGGGEGKKKRKAKIPSDFCLIHH